MKLLIIPWGTPHWSPQSPNVSETLRLKKDSRVLYLVPFWGLLSMKAIMHNRELLSCVNGLKDRQLHLETAKNIRSWLMHNEKSFDKIVFLSYAKGGKFWTQGAAGLPCMKKVKIVRWKSSSPTVVKRDIDKLLS